MRSAPRFLLGLSLLAAILALTAPAASARRAPVLVEADLVQRINDFRIANGRAPIAADARLAPVAGSHATTMARTSSLVHGDLTRILRAVGVRRAGEVIGIGVSPAGMVGQWAASPLHRSILLDRRFTMSGAGVAAGTLNGAFAWYVTVDFAG